MSKSHVYVYSTLSADNIYADYVKGGADLPKVEKSVLIHGGANVADKRLITPRGAVTKVSAEDMAWLKDNYHFKFHQDGGFLTVSDHMEDVEKVIGSEGMEGRDASSPLVPQDFEGQSGAKPSDVRAADAEPPIPPAAQAAQHPAASGRSKNRA